MYQPRPILKSYYESLENGKVLGMRCGDCTDVVWPPLPTCQKCGSTNMSWLELSGEATIEEFSFQRAPVSKSGSFIKGNPFFVSDEPYCLCTGRLKEGTAFNAALFGVTAENVDDLTRRLPFVAKAELIELEGGFKSVGFRAPK
jgi:uncharacterized OB-fold protein